MAAVSFFLSFFSFSAQKERTHCKEKIKHSNQVRGIPNLSTPFYQAQVFYVDIGTSFKGIKTLILLFMPVVSFN
jgi:hypothetical protein